MSWTLRGRWNFRGDLGERGKLFRQSEYHKHRCERADCEGHHGSRISVYVLHQLWELHSGDKLQRASHCRSKIYEFVTEALRVKTE